MRFDARKVPWVAVGLSLLLRAVYFVQVRENPYFAAPVMDEGYHDLWAREIAGGDLTSRIPFFRAPLYPFLLGGAYRLAGGPDFTAVRGAQLLLGAATPLLVWAIARRLLPGRPGLAGLAAVVTALDGMLIYFEAELLLEALLAPLSALLVLLILRAMETGAPTRWLAAGLGLGAFAVTRPNVLLFAPVLAVVALGWKPPRWRRALALTAGTCLLVLPVTLVNWRAGGDLVLVAWQGGLNFFLGNNAEANGWSATAPSIFRVDWWGGYEDAIALAEEAEGRKLLPSEVSDHWYARAREWWRENPLDGIVLTARKVVYLLSGVEFGNNRDDALFFREFVPAWLPFLHVLTVMMPLAVVGAIALWRRGDGPVRIVILFAAVYSVTVILFFVTGRYRVPLRPLLAIFAVEGGRWLWERMRRGGLRGALPTVATAAAAFLVDVNPWTREYAPPPAQFYQSVANVHRTNGDLRQALEWQLRTLESDPAYPEGNLNLGTMYLDLGNAEAAVEAFRREQILDPGDGKNLASMAQALEKLGRTEDAEKAYAAAEAAGLEDAPALYNHALCLERLGRGGEEVEALYRRAVAQDSTFADAWNNWGVLLARAGRLPEAVPLWERAVAVRPDHPRAFENLQRARQRLAEGGNDS
ncbi:MAG: tetratricopeptide repeat protein [Candidatus Eiseniibacteriota bacterium]